MKYSLSLGGDLLTPARDAFDKMMLGVIDRMKKRGLYEGSVTLKLSITLAKQFPVDEDGNEQEIFVPIATVSLIGFQVVMSCIRSTNPLERICKCYGTMQASAPSRSSAR